METPEQPRATRPFRQWDENGNFSVAIDRELDTSIGGRDSGDSGEIAVLWPRAAVDTLLTAWGYDCEAPEGWMEIDTILWHHIDSLYSLFIEYDRGGPAPFRYEASSAVEEYDRANKDKPNSRSKERGQLLDQQENERLDNSRWLAEYTLKWLDAGLRLLEVAGGQR